MGYPEDSGLGIEHTRIHGPPSNETFASMQRNCFTCIDKSKDVAEEPCRTCFIESGINGSQWRPNTPREVRGTKDI